MKNLVSIFIIKMTIFHFGMFLKQIFVNFNTCRILEWEGDGVFFENGAVLRERDSWRKADEFKCERARGRGHCRGQVWRQDSCRYSNRGVFRIQSG